MAAWALCITIPDDRGDESFADDLNMGRGIVSGRVALLLRSTEIPPHRPNDLLPLFPAPNSRVTSLPSLSPPLFGTWPQKQKQKKKKTNPPLLLPGDFCDFLPRTWPPPLPRVRSRVTFIFLVRVSSVRVPSTWREKGLETLNPHVTRIDVWYLGVKKNTRQQIMQDLGGCGVQDRRRRVQHKNPKNIRFMEPTPWKRPGQIQVHSRLEAWT
jgi:hypothetical protein